MLDHNLNRIYKYSKVRLSDDIQILRRTYEDETHYILMIRTFRSAPQLLQHIPSLIKRLNSKSSRVLYSRGQLNKFISNESKHTTPYTLEYLAKYNPEIRATTEVAAYNQA